MGDQDLALSLLIGTVNREINDTGTMIDEEISFASHLPGISVVPTGKNKREIFGELIWPVCCYCGFENAAEELVA
jgi:hypothetical protein